MLKYQTHTEFESGTSLRVLSKPPVNAPITDLSFTGKTYQDGTPTPSVPIKMASVPQSFNTTSCGKNLFIDTNPILYNYNNTEKTLITNGIRATYTSTSKTLGFFTMSFSNYSYVSGKKIAISCVFNSSSNNTGRYIIGYSDSNGDNRKVLAQSYISNTLLSVTYPTDLVGKIPIIWFYSNGDNIANIGDYIDYTNIFIFNDTTGLTQTNNLLSANCIGYDDFESFPATGTIGQQVKANDTGLLYDWNGSNYQPTKLRSVGTVADTISSETGKRNIRVAERTFNGTESWAINTDYTTETHNVFQINITNVKAVSVCKCTHATYKNPSGVANTCRFAAFYFVFEVLKSEIADVAAFKTWLASNPMTVDYELATPIITDLNTAEVAKMKAQTQYQYETNINTNVETNTKPTINCWVRKLGNKGYTVTEFIDENGNILADENGDYIGGLF